MSHPFFFTWQAQKDARAYQVTGGDGAWFETSDGSRWLDMGSLSYQASLGHGNQRMVEAIRAQAAQLSLAAPWAVFPAKTEAAEALLSLAPPGFSRVFFTLGGAEANENALKIARMVTGRYKLVSRYRSYHGATMGALSLTGDFRRPPVEPGLVGVIRVGEGAAAIEEVLELEGPGTVAAVFLEAVPGANGVLIPDDDYWPRVRAACDADGALLVADEVLTGFGRTGRCFGFEHFGAVPDMITVAKAVTGGYAPLGAVLVHERIADHFEDEVLYAGLTTYAHPLGCAAAREAIGIYMDDDLFARAAELGEQLREELIAVKGRSAPAVTAVRSIGMLAALDLDLSEVGWVRLDEELSARRVFLHLSARRKTAIFAPPLIVERDEIDEGITVFSEALAAAIRHA